jgi:hypothetical protein
MPKEKLKSDSGLKEVFREIGKKAGKNFTEQQLNAFVSQFRNMSRTENMGSLMDKLAKRGFSQNDLNQIKRRFNK